LLHVDFLGASLGFNNCKHVFTCCTLKQMFMYHMHVGNRYVSSFSQKIGMHKCKVYMQNYLNYQNLPVGIIQIYCICAIDMILQSIHRIEPVSTYLHLKQLKYQNLPLGMIHVSDAICNKYGSSFSHQI
jgi:hypothetical protein